MGLIVRSDSSAVESGPSSRTEAEEFDVAVIGCGPVGAALATLLGQAGQRVVIIERHTEAYPLPRAVHFDHEVARILQSCGLGPDLPSISESAGIYEWRNGTGTTLLRFGGRPVGPSGWPDTNMFWQPALEERLEHAAAGQRSVELRRGVRLVGLLDGPDGCVLTTERDDGTTEHLRVRFAVGCDGANSTVRDLMGVTTTDLGFFYDWLIVDVVLHESRVFDPVNLQICDPSRPTTAVSGGPGRRRWEFMRLPHETIDELDDPARAWELLEPWDVTADNATLERHAVYRFHARWADRWRVGNVLLAGDAAHQMPPFAGQGMCSGLRDAVNLAWKLDLVLAGRSPDALLDAYEIEREQNVRAVIDFSMSLGKVICVTDPDEAAERDALMADTTEPGVSLAPPPLPGIGNGIVSPGDPLAGELFIQGRVTGGGGAALFDDVWRSGWRLVSMDEAVAASISADDLEWFAGLGGTVVTVTAGDDVDGTYGTWFAEHDVIAALQRPDFVLFGAAPTLREVEPLLESLRGTLDRPHERLVPTPSAQPLEPDPLYPTA